MGPNQVLHFLSVGQRGGKGIYFRREVQRGKLRDFSVLMVGISKFDYIKWYRRVDCTLMDTL